MKDRIRYIIAVALGVLAIPGLALASNAALSSSADDAADTTTTSTSVVASEIAAEDLVRACGAEGRYLVDLEAAGAINQVQQAALDALRPLCDDASLPLPGRLTVGAEPTIVATAPAVGTTNQPAATSTATSGSDFESALGARERALVAIQAATDAGGNVDTINTAISLVGDGDFAYDSGEFANAVVLYEQAESLANDAALDPQPTAYYDDDDDHEDEDHEDHEDEDHEDEEEDEEDEDHEDEDDD
ncbi:MAG: hypothetical protein HKN93_02995 [Acidimicrobiia bacterium]|nr:hypothetical protein [Acidimicrobiia bacterium]